VVKGGCIEQVAQDEQETQTHDMKACSMTPRGIWPVQLRAGRPLRPEHILRVLVVPGLMDFQVTGVATAGRVQPEYVARAAANALPIGVVKTRVDRHNGTP